MDISERKEWLKQRQQGVGASEVAAVMGLSKFRTPLDVYLEKVAPDPVEREETPLMRAGNILEDVIAEWWEMESARKVRRDNKVRRHKDYPFMTCSLDRTIVALNGEGPGILECKNVNANYFKHWPDYGVVIDYYAQVQHQIDVTGYDWAELAALVGGNEFHRFPIAKDDEFISQKNKALIDFWENHVKAVIPPDPSTEGEIKSVYPAVSEKIIDAVEPVYQAYLRARVLKAEIAKLTEEYDLTKLQVQMAMRDAEVMEYYGVPIATWKQGKDTEKFDKSKLKKAYPEVYKACVTTAPGNRTFLFKEEK